MRLIDTRLHYGFLPPVSRKRLKTGIAQEDVEIIAQTIRLSGFIELERENFPMVAVGYHPWYIDDNCEHELEISREALPCTHFVSKIGSDFIPRRLDDVPAETQIHAFTSTLNTVQVSGLSHILSIRTARSADTVLDLLEQGLVSNSGSISGKNLVPIFHRFGGTSDELTRLIRAGDYISVNSLILRTKRGRAYVSQVPANRLLLETDLPCNPGNGDAVEVVSVALVVALRDTVAEVMILRSMSKAELKSALAESVGALDVQRLDLAICS